MGLNQSKPNKAKQSPSKPQLQAAEQHGIGLPLPTGNTPPLLQHQQAQIVPPSSSNSNFFMNPLASPEVYSIGSIHQTPNGGGGGYSPIQPDLGNSKTQYEPSNAQIDGSAHTSPRQYRADPKAHRSATPIRTWAMPRPNMSHQTPCTNKMRRCYRSVEVLTDLVVLLNTASNILSQTNPQTEAHRAARPIRTWTMRRPNMSHQNPSTKLEVPERFLILSRNVVVL
uniref:Uncharacterized protein n=2 Tax=Globodera rostochiensis TaxID=31243 RepID=A0A914HD24_GLORO